MHIFIFSAREATVAILLALRLNCNTVKPYETAANSKEARIWNDHKYSYLHVIKLID